MSNKNDLQKKYQDEGAAAAVLSLSPVIKSQVQAESK